MAELLPGLINLREQLVEPRRYTFTNLQAYLIALVTAVIGVLIYIQLRGRSEVRYSTALTIGAIIFLVILNLLDFPDRRWVEILTVLVIAGIVLEIVGYEVLRIIKRRNIRVGLNVGIETED
jgi:hypothetical protein